MRRMKLGGLTLMAALAITACGDSATDVLGDPLTQEEAEALAEVVGQTVFATWADGGEFATHAAPVAALTIEQDFEAEVPCELGGQLMASGTTVIEIDDDTEDVTFDYSLTQVHQGCIAASQDGTVFTLNGAPNISVDLFLQTEGDLFSMSGGYSGAVDWSTEGKSGTCSMSVELTITVNAATESGSGSLAGTVCGVSFSENVSFS